MSLMICVQRLPNQLPLPGGHAPCLNDASLLKVILFASRCNAFLINHLHQLPRVGQSSSNSSKFPRDDSSKPVNKPARVPFVPRPPYRPSEADIAKLKSKKKSKSTSTSYSITPEYARGATSRAAPPSNLTHLPPAPEVQMESETEMDAVKSEREDNVNLEARSPSASPDCADFVRRVWTPQPEDDSDSDSDSDSESESESEEEEEEEGESDSRTSDEDETPILGSIPVYSDSPIIERENRKRPYDAVSEESGSDRGDVAVESDEDALCEANDRARPWATVRGKQKLPPLSFKKKWKPE
ncbi:hypothetical protein C0992_006850 [Termitomyces sp. T32_za158]|nr:hypothetical protein C0992_006850 [Termitomyces sp. T32_za158]